MSNLLEGAWAAKARTRENLAYAISAGVVPYTAQPSQPSAELDEVDRILTLPIEGILFAKESAAAEARQYGMAATSYEGIIDTIESQPSASILFTVDSPGGVVRGLDRAQAYIASLDRVIATYITGECQSAAYMLIGGNSAPIYACARDVVVGSLAILISEYIPSEAKRVTNTDGAAKRLETPEGAKAAARLADSLIEPLAVRIQAARGVQITTTGGASFTAEEATALNLINGIEETIELVENTGQ